MGRTLSDNYLVPEHSVVTVGTTNTSVVASNYDRNYLLLVNDGTEAIYISFGANAALNTGIRLNAEGGNYEMGRGYGNIFQGAINAICTSGGMKLLVTEGT